MQDKTKDTEEQAKQLASQLELKFPNLWDVADEAELKLVQTFTDAYKTVLDEAKTEREFVQWAVPVLEIAGFVPIRSQERLKAGDKVYQVIRGKGLAAAVVGTATREEGYAILGAHVDSPRFDAKPTPIYEDKDMVLMKTHYYGGVKKYQWTTIPLALHATLIKQDGSVRSLTIGEKADDPVFTFTDLLVHLSAEQLSKPASKVIEGEEFNLLIGGRPHPADVPKRFKLGVLQLLHDTYDLTERDFATAEIQIVPAGQARDVGLDRSFIGAYGQDDRVCAYPALRAIMDLEQAPRRTAVCLLTDKEEVGSAGNSGAQSLQYETFLADLFARSQDAGYDELGFRYAMENSRMLSADVTNGIDPTFASASDERNSAWLGRGIALVKVTGSRGKNGASEASSEFMAEVTRLFDENSVPWQTGEMGKVDLGGGGTISKFFANKGMEVLDCGVPVLSMHAPFELTHKLDVYYTYLAYRCFVEKLA